MKKAEEAKHLTKWDFRVLRLYYRLGGRKRVQRFIANIKHQQIRLPYDLATKNRG